MGDDNALNLPQEAPKLEHRRDRLSRSGRYLLDETNCGFLISDNRVQTGGGDFFFKFAVPRHFNGWHVIDIEGAINSKRCDGSAKPNVDSNVIKGVYHSASLFSFGS